MSLRFRARFGLLAILLAIPLATAQVPGITPPLPTTPPSDPTTTPPTDGVLAIQEGPLTILGPANAPTTILIEGADGANLVAYTVDADGRARLDVAGENAVNDATFLRLEGDPTGNAFSLVLLDPQGGIHRVDVDKAALLEDAPPIDDPTKPFALPVTISRPIEWPGAPTRSYLLHIKDGAMNQLAGGSLNGDSFLRLAGNHMALVQIPLAEHEWDRVFAQVRREGQPGTHNATFAQLYATDDVTVLGASYAPASLAPAEGDRLRVDLVYEKRLAPILVERFLEPATHRYRVDGQGPTVSINAPSQSIDFRFTLTWTGSDTLSGIGGYSLSYREAGKTGWVHWMTTPASSGIFSGGWGKTYELQIRSFDKVGNPSEPKFATTTVIAQPATEDDVNDAPKAKLLTPISGSELFDVVQITWQASDEDATPLTSRIEVSTDDGDTYRLLYVGPDLATSWDTTNEADGAGYRIRLTVSDGTQTVQESATALKVRNIIAPLPPGSSAPTDPATPTSAPTSPGSNAPGGGTTGGDEPTQPAGTDATPEGGNDTPVPFALVPLAIVGAALLLARRRRT